MYFVHICVNTFFCMFYVTDQSEEAEEVREGIPHHSRAAGTAGGAHREI